MTLQKLFNMNIFRWPRFTWKYKFEADSDSILFCFIKPSASIDAT